MTLHKYVKNRTYIKLRKNSCTFMATYWEEVNVKMENEVVVTEEPVAEENEEEVEVVGDADEVINEVEEEVK